MQLAQKIIEDLRDFSSVVTNYGYQPVLVPARKDASNHVILFLDGAGRTHLVSVVVPKNGEAWSDAAVATARVHSERIGKTHYSYETAYSRPEDVEPLRRVIPARADAEGVFRGRRLGVDVPEHYPQVSRYIDAVDDAFRRAGQKFIPVDIEGECIVTDPAVRDILAKMESIGDDAGVSYRIEVAEGVRSGRLTRLTLSRGDGVETDAAVTENGSILCSVAVGSHYHEFEASSVKDYLEAIDDAVDDLIEARQDSLKV